MATRERKPRNATDSPVSSVVSDSTPTTPSSRGRGGARGRGRGRSRVARGRTASNATDTATNNDDNETTQSNVEEELPSGKQTPQPPSRTPSRSSNAVKEEIDDTTTTTTQTDANKVTKSPTKADTVKPLGRKPRNSSVATVAVAVATNNRPRRSNAGAIRRGGGIVKRRSLPAGIPVVRGTSSRRSLPNKAVIKTDISISDLAAELKMPTRKRNLRGAALKKAQTEENVIFKKPAGVTDNTTDSGAATDTEVTNARRRRSSSKSTDTVASCPDIIDSDFNVKKEAIEDEETVAADPAQKQNILEKMAENFSEAKVTDIKINQIKRSGRPRRATVSKDAKPINEEIKKAVDEKSSNTEVVVEVTTPGIQTLINEQETLKIETEVTQPDPSDTNVTAEVQKDSSLSPQLSDSVGVSEISVKTFYGEPAFLENNLGIEKDPKLGEIVQVQKTVITDSEESTQKETEDDTVIGDKIEAEIVKKPTIEEPIKEDLEENKENASIITEDSAVNDKKDEFEKQLEAAQAGGDMMEETEEQLLKEKEKHFFSLGLLTHEAAVEAEKQKNKLREMRFRNGANKSEKRRGNNSEYTGTLKTIIKLNRTSPEKRKSRMPLKMTIHKGRLKHGSEKDINGSASCSEQTFYIQTDKQGEQQHEGLNLEKEKGRKGHNRSHNDVAPHQETSEITKEEKSLIIIPEKASSFKVHPDRICLDQCAYCGGKFGLYDTPCHIAQMKSGDSQDKILKSEEKLTRDSCLCDACFRHIDRKANSPSYRKRLSASQIVPASLNQTNQAQSQLGNNAEHNISDSAGQEETEKDLYSSCCVINCTDTVAHSLRKKWLAKMKKQVSKIINIDNDLVNDAQTLIPICDTHYQTISHLMICSMCKRRLSKNHIYFIAQDIQRLERLLYIHGIPLNFGDVSLIVCKLCRYYANLLLKPQEAPQKILFIKTYSKRLLQILNTTDDDAEAGRSTYEDAQTPKSTLQLREHRKHRKSNDTMQDIHEPDISIIPSKASTLSSTPTAGHIMLDNDVMVDYDTPILEHVIHKRTSRISGAQKERTAHHEKEKDKFTSDMAKALKANPNISMRELFPGEEDMNLQMNIPFTVGGSRTPEGWTRVQATMQYDEDTRLLWEELQKPYGNQSSFIRHLVLLEKYYRNGDLVLSSNASSNAISYSESVQNRLRSYDNGPGAVVTSESLNILQQLSNAPITIIPTSKSKQRPETNKNEKRKHSAIEIKRSTKSQQQHQPASKMQKMDDQKNFPPDLISINPSTSAGQQTQKSPPNVTVMPTTAPRKSPGASNQQIIKLPDTLTPMERKETAKPWRPTLLPITPGVTAAISHGPLYQTADGRKLPGLVQVMSSQKPYHISIYDYNRMCILRREKLMQLQQQNHQGASSKTPQKSSTTSESAEVAAKTCSIPNKILEQNSVIPIINTPKSSQSNTPVTKEQQKVGNNQNSSNGGTSLLKNYVPIAPKLPTTPNTSLLPPAVSITSKASTSSTSSTPTTGHSAMDALIKMDALKSQMNMQNNMYLWSEGYNLSSPNMINNSGGSILVDNSVLSKIPKSLTVIAQQKERHDAKEDAST